MLSRSTIFLGLMLTVSLALATLVRDDDSASSEVILPTPRASSSMPQDGSVNAYPTLQLEKLARAEFDDAEHNPFAGKSSNASFAFPHAIPTLRDADKSVAEAGQSFNESDHPSTVPSMPFNYMGRIQEEGGRPVVFFTQGAQAYAVSEGEEIDDTYRLERILPTQLVLVNLPLKTRQTIDVIPLETESEEGDEKTWTDTHSTYHRELQRQGQSRKASGNGL